MKNSKFILLVFILFFFLTNSANAATYYLTAAGAANAQTAASWNTNAAGGGTSASNFTTSGDIFIVPSGRTGSFVTNTTFGSGVQLQVIGAISVAPNNGATATLTINSGATIDFQSSTSQITATSSGNSTENFTLSSGATLITANTNGFLSTAQGASTTIAGKNFGTISLDPAANYQFNGAAQTLTGIPSTVNNLVFGGSGIKTLPTTLTTISGNLVLNGTATVTTVVALSVGGNLTVGDGTNASTLNTDAFTLTVTGTTTIANASVLEITSATGTKSFNGDFVVNSGGSFINTTVNEPLTLPGSITNNGTFNAGTGTYTLSGTTKTISGTLTIPTVSCTGTYTNNGTLTVSTALNGAGTLTQGASSVLNLTGTISAVTLNASTSGNTVNYNGGSQTIYNTTYSNLILAGSGIKTTSAAMTVNGDLTVNSGVTFRNNLNNFNVSIGGNLTNNGTFTSGSGTYTFSGATKTLNGTLSFVTASISGTYTNSGTMTVSTTLNGAGGLTMGNSATLNVGGTFSTTTFDAATNAGNTVNYTGAAQTIKSVNYQNLTLSGSGNVSLTTGSTIAGNLSLSGTVIATAANSFTIGGNLSIATSNTFDASSRTISVAGNWSNAGTFNASTSTVVFTGNNNTQSLSGTNTFNNLTINHSGTGGVTATGSTLTVGTLLRIQSGSFTGASTYTNVQIDAGATYIATTGATINVSGDWTNNGSFTASTSTVVLNGSSAQTISGSTNTAFYNLTFNGSGLKTLSNASSVTNTMTLTSGIMQIGTNDFQVNSFSSGSASSYIRTNSTGRVKQSIAINGSKVFHIGNSTYNPATITNKDSSPTGTIVVRVADETNTNANDVTQTLNRRWYISKVEAGDVNITAALTYYSTDSKGASFNTTNPELAHFTGDYWMSTTATSSGTEPKIFTGDMTLMDITMSPNQYLALGSGTAFNATNFTISLFPTNPTLGVNSVITVSTVNSQGINTCVNTATGFSITPANTTISPSPLTGTIAINTHQTILSGVQFKTINETNTATLSVASTSGESLSTSTSSTFKVINGTIYEPMETTTIGSSKWKVSTDGGTTWTLTNQSLPIDSSQISIGENILLRIPNALTVTVNQNMKFYSMFIESGGSVEVTSGGTLRLFHTASDLSDYNLHVHGTLTNSGGDIINYDGTNGNTYKIDMHGGKYIHARNGGSIPIAIWETFNGTKSSCEVTGISTTALTSGLNQHFQDFKWDNASQGSTIQYINGNIHVLGALNLANGVLTTGTDYVIEGELGSLTRTNGYINGNFRLYVPDTNDAATFNFPIGEGSVYAPVSVTFSGATSGSGYIDAHTTTIVTPPFASGLSQTNFIKRKWVISSNGVNFDKYAITLNYNDVDKAGSPTNLVLRRLSNGTWFNTGGISTTNTITATDQNTFSEFYIGEANCSTQLFWFGSVSNNWNTAGNWCSGAVPDSTNNVVVPGGITNYPVMSANGECKALTLESGATLETGAFALSVYGHISNAGTISSSSGTVNMVGKSAQNISGAGTTTFNHLTVNNTGGVSSTANITVNGTLTLTTSNPSNIKGALDMVSSSILFMGENSSTAGINDVTGYVKRQHIFTPNTSYSFGASNTSITFAGTGTHPQWIQFKIELLESNISTPYTFVLRRYYITADNSGYTDNCNLRLHYHDTELNSKDENKLVIYDYHTSTTGHQHGYASRNNSDNWIQLNDFNISYVATTSVNKYWYMDESTTTRNTWQGPNAQTNWNTNSAWSFGHVPGAGAYTGEDVYIPVKSNNVYPELSSDIQVNTLEIGTGAKLTANSYIISINGSANAWVNNGTFIPGTGTVNFNNSSLSNTVELGGTSDFYNIQVGATTKLQAKTNAVTKISGGIGVTSGGLIDFRTNENTVEYHTMENYSILNPTDGTNTGYYHLSIHNMDGTLSFPSGNLNVKGNLSVNGIISATGNTVIMDGVQLQNLDGNQAYTLNHLTIDNATGVDVTASDWVNVGGTMTINSGKLLQVPAGKKLNAASVVNNAGVNGLVLKAAAGQPNASFKFSNLPANPVSATVEMYSKAYAATNNNGIYSNHQWQFIGVPVKNFAKSNPLLSGTYMRKFNEALSTGWTLADNTLVGFRGYSITQPIEKTITWQGELFNQDETIVLSYTESATFTGYNLVANSFTSAVNIGSLQFGAGVNPNVFLFNTGKAENDATVNVDNENTTPGQYINVPRNNAGAGGLPTTISSMQAFFLSSNSTIGNTLTIPYSITTANTSPMRAPSQMTPNDFTMIISVTGEKYADKIWLFGNPTCTNLFDSGWDGIKMFGVVAAPQLYIKSNEDFLQVQTTNTPDRTIFGINKGEDSLYTFKFKVENAAAYFPDGLYLIDTKTNEYIKITDNQTSYTFEVNANEDASTRFVLSKSPSLNTDTQFAHQQAQINIFSIQDKICVQNRTEDDLQIKVSDLTGKMVMQSRVAAFSEDRIPTQLPVGMYTVSAQSSRMNQNQLIRLTAQ